MKNTITIIMLAITLLAMLIGMSSCYTERAAQRQVDKAHHKYPLVAAKFCAEKYVPTDSVSIVKEYIPGKDVIHTDTVVETQVVADTITVTKYITKISRVTDTLRDTKYVVQENKAAIKLLQSENRKLSDANLLLGSKLSAWRNWALAGWGLLLLLVLWRIVSAYLKFGNI